MSLEFLLDFFHDRGWDLVYKFKRAPRTKQSFPLTGLPLSDFSQIFLTTQFPNGLYRHQIEALRRFLNGEAVGITTGAASGKSIVFYTAAVEVISRDPGARISAIFLVEANLQIKETVCGFKERRGSTEISKRYPLSPTIGIKFAQEYLPVIISRRALSLFIRL